VKGAILSRAPSATIVDLTHAVPPQDVRAGAFLLWTAVSAFPSGTTHLAVIDPGVGSSRRALALATRRGHYLVGPDNGLLIPAADRLGGVLGAVALATPDGASATFHGRDVFAPAAARLASGAALTDVGESCQDLVQLTIPAPNGDVGEVIHVDAYGNLITNFPASAVTSDTKVSLGNDEVAVAAYYAMVQSGDSLALIGSAGLLEISVRDGNAADRLGAGRGTRVVLSRQPRPE
jgi:S-adenosylmethionine hydrolase